MGERHPAPSEELPHQRRLLLGVLHHHPVEVGHQQESVAQAGELGLLLGARVRGGDGEDGRQVGVVQGGEDGAGGGQLGEALL